MQILCLTQFRDGIRTFEEGDRCTVTGDEGIRFVAHGWAVEVQSQEKVETDLVVHNSKIGVASKEL